MDRLSRSLCKRGCGGSCLMPLLTPGPTTLTPIRRRDMIRLYVKTGHPTGVPSTRHRGQLQLLLCPAVSRLFLPVANRTDNFRHHLFRSIIGQIRTPPGAVQLPALHPRYYLQPLFQCLRTSRQTSDFWVNSRKGCLTSNDQL